MSAKAPGRNDPCSCGSGRKFKAWPAGGWLPLLLNRLLGNCRREESLFRTKRHKSRCSATAVDRAKRLFQELLISWCGRGDSNPHALATASPSS
ncbi:MAG: SEC-C domain-containing protein [Acidobacteria bacterium]|nr:SEC-C domain-containing protein [Acidobacteriota bacterium]